MTLNPIKLVRRRLRLRRAIEEEALYLRRRHGVHAHAAALEKLRRPNLTGWGRKIVEGAAKQTLVNPYRANGSRAVHKAEFQPRVLNPIKLARRRGRLRRAIDEEVIYLRRAHGIGAYPAALEKLKRRDLTGWGRKIVEGAAERVLLGDSRLGISQALRQVRVWLTIPDPIKLIRKRRQLRQAVEEEVAYLRRNHGQKAYAVALEKLEQPHLTSWGRKIAEGAAKQVLVGAYQVADGRTARQAQLRRTTLNPIRLVRRSRRLRRAIEEEVFYLRRFHGEGAHAAALEKLKRADLTSWGRKIVQGAAEQALAGDSRSRVLRARKPAQAKPAVRLDPVGVFSRRSRLRRAIEDEVMYLRRAHGPAAYTAALEKLREANLTQWGRQIVLGAAKQVSS